VFLDIFKDFLLSIAKKSRRNAKHRENRIPKGERIFKMSTLILKLSENKKWT